MGNAPFIDSLRKSFAEGDDNVVFRMTGILAKVSFALILFLSVRALATIVQTLIGHEIVQEEEEIVVVETTKVGLSKSKIRRGKKD